MICKDCGEEYKEWSNSPYPNNLCLICNEWHWRMFEKDECTNFRRIDELEKQGHSNHCACRQVWGDGECECDLYEKGYDPYAWMRANQLRKENGNI
ncbi:MAG: hypothetical protein ACFFCW_30760 [Candidatus Hodarchaeota archaeon]